MSYKKMYFIMIDGAEKAIEAIEAGDYNTAKQLLIDAEQRAEEVALQTGEAENGTVIPFTNLQN